jgi:tRNA A37 methylthiotransferase MiaB
MMFNMSMPLSKTILRPRLNTTTTVFIQQIQYQQPQNLAILLRLFGTEGTVGQILPTTIIHRRHGVSTTVTTNHDQRRLFSRQRDRVTAVSTSSSSSLQMEDEYDYDHGEVDRTASSSNTTKGRRKQIFFQSLGCPRNFVDTEVMVGLSIRDGTMDVTTSVGDADVIVVNTCGFLQSAREESKGVIQSMIDSKKKDCKLIVTGCMVNLLKHQQQRQNQQQQDQKNQRPNGNSNKSAGQQQQQQQQPPNGAGGEIEFLQDFPQIDVMLSAGEIDQVVERIQALDIQKERDNNEKNRKRNKKMTKGSSRQQQQLQQDDDHGNDDDTFLQQQHHYQQQHRTPVAVGSAMQSMSYQRSSRRSFLERGDTPRFLATPPHYAYIKIAEGCRKRCSFCVIPTIKGRLQSKPIHQVVDEFTTIRHHGNAKEIILIAQDLGDYGKDWKKSTSTTAVVANDDTTAAAAVTIAINDGGGGGGCSPDAQQQNQDPKSPLTLLLEALLKSMDDDEEEEDDRTTERNRFWLRLLYLYPDEITPDLITVMANDTRIARYVDLPIQHSHDDILRSMRRKTSSVDIVNTITLLRRHVPDVSIRTSLMVGYPGETERHFQHLLDFVKEVQLDHVGVFMYSNEELAHSSKLPNHVSQSVKEDRYNRLMATQLSIVEERNKERVARKERLLIVIEGIKENDDDDPDDHTTFTIVGRHVGQCPDIDGQVLLEGQPRVYPGERYWVEVTGYDGHDLIAKVLPEEEEDNDDTTTTTTTITRMDPVATAVSS